MISFYRAVRHTALESCDQNDSLLNPEVTSKLRYMYFVLRELYSSLIVSHEQSVLSLTYKVTLTQII